MSAFKVVSFNVNGLRARLHQLQQLIDDYAPDVIGLQETKVHNEEFPLAELQAMGYHVVYHGQKGHYGVAMMTREKPLRVEKGLPDDDEESQKRFIAVELPLGKHTVTVMNGYFPQGESRDHPTKFPAKAAFYRDLQHWLNTTQSPDKPLIVMGDLNISGADADVGIGADNAKRWLRDGKCSFLPEERAWLQQLKDWGLEDSYRRLYEHVDDRFSWFDYRSRGFDREPKRGLRIDLILATAPLIEHLTEAGIAYDIRAMSKPSDHCPVWADFTLPG
ncbi:MAG: exodeoxyribonuclease III [Halomonadaceae bacterium]|nr:MAG: exodeoxyribonuclease III [Halomonadaceae bacterium]